MAGSVSVLLVRPLVAALGSARLDAFWTVTDLTPEIVADDDARITPAQFCVAWAELVRVTGDPQIALSIASALPAGSFGIVEYVCRAAATFGRLDVEHVESAVRRAFLDGAVLEEHVAHTTGHLAADGQRAPPAEVSAVMDYDSLAGHADPAPVGDPALTRIPL